MATKTVPGADRAAPATKTVKALVPIEHDQTPYDVGDTFDVTDADLKQLREVNAVELVAAAPAAAA